MSNIARPSAILLLAGVSLFAMPADAATPKECTATLSIVEVASGMGGKVRPQPVFSAGELKGWRLYSTTTSRQLSALGVSEGTLMTHICGVSAREVFATKQDACCPGDVSREFEVTIEVAGAAKKVVISR